MTEIPIFVNTDEVTVGGVVDQVELQLSVGAQGERGSRIFSGDASPLTLPADHPCFAGYTEFISGDVYVERSMSVLALWEWKSQPGGYTWVQTATISTVEGGGGYIDADLEAIAALSGTNGLLRKTAINTWTLDTNSYLTSNQMITLSGDVSGTGTSSITTTVADDSHSHTGATISALDAADTTTGTFDIARIPTGSTGSTVALGNHTHSYQPVDADLTAIAALAGTSGLLKKTAADTWALDTTSYLSTDYSGTVTDNAVVRWDGTSGSAVQNSGVTISDTNGVTVNGGYVQVSPSSGSPFVQVSASASGTYSEVDFTTAGSSRWRIRKNATAESGSNAGSNLEVQRRDDSGSTLSTITINRATGKITLPDVGSSAGLEFGSSGPRMMMGTGTPSGVSAPVGSTWRQTDANSSHGNLTGLLWNKVGTGTTEGTDWLVDFEGRWVSYTPTISGFSLGSGSTTEAKYTRTGKVCTFRVYCKMGTSPTAAASLSATLPVTGTTSEKYTLPAFVLDAGSNYYPAYAVLNSTAQVTVWGNAAALNALGFTWAVNDIVSVNGAYEIA